MGHEVKMKKLLIILFSVLCFAFGQRVASMDQKRPLQLNNFNALWQSVVSSKALHDATKQGIAIPIDGVSRVYSLDSCVSIPKDANNLWNGELVIGCNLERHFSDKDKYYKELVKVRERSQEDFEEWITEYYRGVRSPEKIDLCPTFVDPNDPHKLNVKKFIDMHGYWSVPLPKRDEHEYAYYIPAVILGGEKLIGGGLCVTSGPIVSRDVQNKIETVKTNYSIEISQQPKVTPKLLAMYEIVVPQYKKYYVSSMHTSDLDSGTERYEFVWNKTSDKVISDDSPWRLTTRGKILAGTALAAAVAGIAYGAVKLYAWFNGARG